MKKRMTTSQAHDRSFAAKRAEAEERGILLADFPSARQSDFNYNTGGSDSSCGEAGCECVAYKSPNG